MGVGTESGREMGRERDRERRRTRNLAPTWVRRRRARRERSRLPRAAYSFLFSLCARVARGWREKDRETSTLGHAHIHPVSLAAMVRNGAVRARRVVTRDETPAPHPMASVFLSQTSLPLPNLIPLFSLFSPSQATTTATATPAFMYVRVKRHRACMFLKCAPGDTVDSLKARVEALTQQPAADQRLLGADGGILEDGTTLSDAGVVDGACLGLCHRQGVGSFEALHVEAYDYGGEG